MNPEANQLWRGSPMTYVFDNKQHIAVASGQNILAFALVGRWARTTVASTNGVRADRSRRARSKRSVLLTTPPGLAVDLGEMARVETLPGGHFS